MATNSKNPTPDVTEIEITNTLFFDLSDIPTPNEYDFWKWLHELGCGEDDFEVIDFKAPSPQTTFKPMAVTRFRTEEAFSNFATKFVNDYPKITLKGTDYTVPFKTTCKAHKRVRIFNIPFEVALGEVQTTLEQFGTVVNIEREKPKQTLEKFFKNVVYEKLAVTMDLNKDIPDHIMIRNNKYKVTYPGQPRMCAYCKKEGHTIKQCEKAKNKATTWAQKVKNGKAKDKHQQLNSNDPFPVLQTTLHSNKPRGQVTTEVATSTPLTNRFAALGTSENIKSKRIRDDEEVESHSSDGNLRVEKGKKKKRKTAASKISRDTEKTVGAYLTPATPQSIFPPKSPTLVRSPDTSKSSNNLTIITSEEDESPHVNAGQNQPSESQIETLIRTMSSDQVFIPSDPGTIQHLIRKFSVTENT
jgi:hypothetical protein